MEITVENLIKQFPNCIIIDNNKKTVMVIKEKEFKVYSEKYYLDFINSIDLDKINI